MAGGPFRARAPRHGQWPGPLDRRKSAIYDTAALLRPERAILVALTGGRAQSRVQACLTELANLADSAGAVVVERLVQRRGGVHPATFLSSGKVEELREMCSALRADLTLFDDDLSPAQVRNLERALGTRVVDRSELILAIFARRARTREARLQVELAQLEYLLPRLTRMWEHLSRTGGGIGTRGPGETQLEVDRRRARERIGRLKAALEDVDRERETQRKARRRHFRVAIVGYTNAGKSTLFNALARAAVHTENRLFATLDATTRRLQGGGSGPNDPFAGGGKSSGPNAPLGGDGNPTAAASEGYGGPGRRRPVLLTDTVGFIRKLPHHLVASFRSTLSEVVEADLLVVVVDAADPEADAQLAEVERVLDELGVNGPRILVFNKVDRLPDPTEALGFRARYPGCLLLSALTGEGLDPLRGRLLLEAAQAGRPAAA